MVKLENKLQLKKINFSNIIKNSIWNSINKNNLFWNFIKITFYFEFHKYLNILNIIYLFWFEIELKYLNKKRNSKKFQFKLYLKKNLETTSK